MANLSYGSSGEAVRRMQQALIDQGYDLGKGGADGQWGPDTEKAVREYQGDNELSVDGIAGNNTLGKLYGTAEKEPQVSAYDQYLEDSGYNRYAEDVRKAIEAQTQQTQDAYEKQIADAEEQRQQAAREAYIAKRQSERNLDQRLAAAGYAGGTADSQRIAVENAYQQALSGINTQSREDVEALRRAIIQAQLAGQQQENEVLADYRRELNDNYPDYLTRKNGSSGGNSGGNLSGGYYAGDTANNAAAESAMLRALEAPMGRSSSYDEAKQAVNNTRMYQYYVDPEEMIFRNYVNAGKITPEEAYEILDSLGIR